MGGLPKCEVTLLGIPIVRIIVVWVHIIVPQWELPYTRTHTHIYIYIYLFIYLYRLRLLQNQHGIPYSPSLKDSSLYIAMFGIPFKFVGAFCICPWHSCRGLKSGLRVLGGCKKHVHDELTYTLLDCGSSPVSAAIRNKANSWRVAGHQNMN